MEQVQEDRFVFQVEGFDKQADLIRNYLLTYYPGDGSIDMVSKVEALNMRRTALKTYGTDLTIMSFLEYYSTI